MPPVLRSNRLGHNRIFQNLFLRLRHAPRYHGSLLSVSAGLMSVLPMSWRLNSSGLSWKLARLKLNSSWSWRSIFVFLGKMISQSSDHTISPFWITETLPCIYLRLNGYFRAKLGIWLHICGIPSHFCAVSVRFLQITILSCPYLLLFSHFRSFPRPFLKAL